MLQSYNIKKGLIFSVSIGTLTFLLKLIRFEAGGIGDLVRHVLFVTTNFFLCWLIHHFFLLQNGLKIFSGKYVKGAVSIAAAMACVSLLGYLFGMERLVPLMGHGKELKEPRLFLVPILRSLAISSFVYFAVYYYRMNMILQQSQLENEYLKQENLKAQIASLRQQISPHFLFNSLNTLSTLAADDAAKEYAVKLSDVYRYVLHYQEQNEVSVKNELQFITSYI